MKKLWVAMMVVALSLSMGISTVEAKRFGGGGSFGRQSHSVTRQSRLPAPSQATNPTKPAAPAATPQSTPAKPASPWRNILGGALLGLGLGALLSHFGLGGAMASMISTLLMVGLLVVAVMFIARLFRRKTDDQQPRPAYAGYGGNDPASSAPFDVPGIGSRIEPSQPAALQSAQPASAGTDAAPWGIPAGFDTAGFLRHAKTHFIRMQAAWDKADINDIREFTTPEMYAEVRLQLQERGASPNNTDVVSLEAELLGIETVGDDYLASVRFHGMLKEALNAPAEPFEEVWNLAKPVNGQGGWLLAGIQQVQ